MKNNTSWITGALLVMLFIIGSVWISVSVWNECRGQGNSFFYCLRLISK